MNKVAAPVNIEHRKRAEKAAKASESELSLIINTIPAREWPACPDRSAEFFNQHYLACVRLPSQRFCADHLRRSYIEERRKDESER